MDTTSLLEAAMLTCFGISWPLSAWRMLRLRRPDGRGLLPTALVLAGYLAGMTAKLCIACGGGPLAPVFWLYLLNAGSVSANLGLQWYFSRRGATAARATRWPTPRAFAAAEVRS